MENILLIRNYRDEQTIKWQPEKLRQILLGCLNHEYGWKASKFLVELKEENFNLFRKEFNLLGSNQGMAFWKPTWKNYVGYLKNLKKKAEKKGKALHGCINLNLFWGKKSGSRFSR